MRLFFIGHPSDGCYPLHGCSVKFTSFQIVLSIAGDFDGYELSSSHPLVGVIHRGSSWRWTFDDQQDTLGSDKTAWTYGNCLVS